MDRNTFTACYPGWDFPAVSVTGGRCVQMCSHCRGKHLSGMVSAEASGSIPSLSGRNGVLVSGGCLENGEVPLSDRIAEIEEAAVNGGVNVHAGFADRKTIEALVAAGVDRFSVDIHQDPDVISNVLNLERSPSDYGRLLEEIRDAGGTAVPHLTLGFGERDFRESAELVRGLGFREIVLLTLVPGSGEFTYPSEEETVSAASYLMGLGLSVTLGCMRDRGMRGLEEKLLRLGIVRMANPSAETLHKAEAMGLSVDVDRRCCCMGL